MMQVLGQEFYLLFECLADGCRRGDGSRALRLTFFFLPLARFTAPWRKAIIASCVSKGPKVRPFLHIAETVANGPAIALC
jgi:hypothetical protein